MQLPSGPKLKLNLQVHAPLEQLHQPIMQLSIHPKAQHPLSYNSEKRILLKSSGRSLQAVPPPFLLGYLFHPQMLLLRLRNLQVLQRQVLECQQWSFRKSPPSGRNQSQTPLLLRPRVPPMLPGHQPRRQTLTPLRLTLSSSMPKLPLSARIPTLLPSSR